LNVEDSDLVLMYSRN